MIKETITYTDLNGLERTEDFYFNLSKTEVLEMEMGVDGGLSKMLKNIVANQDGKQIVEYFKMILLKAYGEKATDGKRFIKSKELSTAFSQSPAFDELFMKLATQADFAAAFVRGITPQAETKS